MADLGIIFHEENWKTIILNPAVFSLHYWTEEEIKEGVIVLKAKERSEKFLREKFGEPNAFKEIYDYPLLMKGEESFHYYDYSWGTISVAPICKNPKFDKWEGGYIEIEIAPKNKQ